jgi:hypothetical protein
VLFLNYSVEGYSPAGCREVRDANLTWTEREIIEKFPSVENNKKHKKTQVLLMI